MAVTNLELATDFQISNLAPPTFVLDPVLRANLAQGAKRSIDVLLRIAVPGIDHGGLRIALLVPNGANANCSYMFPSVVCIGGGTSFFPMKEPIRPSFSPGLQEYVLLGAEEQSPDIFTVALRGVLTGGPGGGDVGIAFCQDLARPLGCIIKAGSQMVLNS